MESDLDEAPQMRGLRRMFEQDEVAISKAEGPLTQVSLLGWLQITGSQCSCSTFIPILTGLVFLTDILLVIFVGLDLVNAGLNEPWMQFAWSIAVATLYLALFMASFVQYRWERVLRFRYHWMLALCVCTLLAWINFGVWASWLSKFPDHGDGIKHSDTANGAYTTWVATNAVGVAGFIGRLVIIFVALGLSYTYNRVLELQYLVVGKSNGGQSLPTLLAGRRYRSDRRSRASVGSRTTARQPRNPISAVAGQFGGTNYSENQRRQRNRGGDPYV